MPHECTTCGRVFADGSKEMLSGCPDCGGNKFQFKPATAAERQGSPTAGRDRASAPDADAHPTGTADGDDAPDAGTRRDLSGDSTEWPDHGYGSASASESGTDGRPDASDAERAPHDPGTDGDGAEGTDPASRPTADGSAEDPAQADARTDVVSPDEIAAATPEETEGTATPDAPGSPATGGDDPAATPTGRPPEPRPDDRPDLDDLREELNEQFESIRIVAPGEYELNLMELYDRTEYIISLQEDGRYVIEVPDTWDTTPGPDDA